MFVSLCNKLALFHTEKLDFQSNEDSRRSTSRYMYTLSGFCCFYSNKGILLAYEQFLWLYCLRSYYVIIVEQRHGLEEMHKKEVLAYCEIVQRGDMSVEQNLSVVLSLVLGLEGVCWD